MPYSQPHGFAVNCAKTRLLPKGWPFLVKAAKCTSSHHLTRLVRQATRGELAAVHSKGNFDVVALGNLCVDIVIPVETLPPTSEIKRPELLDALVASSRAGSTDQWEAGAQSNFLIAASRLGMRAASAANLGEDVYGSFLAAILKEEGVQHLEPLAPESFIAELRDTLLCFILVDPHGSHQFCSRYDFGPWPLLPGVHSLPDGVLELLRRTAGVFVNGFVFDELPASVVMSAVRCARAAGASIFFDPGPRAWTLKQGQRRQALDAMLDASDVVLMTEEEAEAVTGYRGADAAAQYMLDRRSALTQWCVVKMGSGGALVKTRSPGRTFQQPAFRVDVADTVGCGDSFAAAIVLGYIHQQPVETVLALSNAVGAATATSCGAGRNVAAADDVCRILQDSFCGTTGRAQDLSARGRDLSNNSEGSSGRSSDLSRTGGPRQPDVNLNNVRVSGNTAASDHARHSRAALQLLRDSLAQRTDPT